MTVVDSNDGLFYVEGYEWEWDGHTEELSDIDTFAGPYQTEEEAEKTIDFLISRATSRLYRMDNWHHPAEIPAADPIVTR
ncbi:MAG: hypothetical protein VW333_05865 [Pseudomonadales bacterium]